MALHQEDAQIFNANGGFLGQITPEWERPSRVELKTADLAFFEAEYPFGPELHIEGRARRFQQPPADLQKSLVVRPGPGLLRRFLKLADASDEQIREFASRFGGLRIFNHPSPSGHIEYCWVWRYFAAVFQALQRIGIALQSGRSASPEDWRVIGELSFLAERSESENEDLWCSLTHYLRLPGRPLRSETRQLFIHLMNALLGLSGVRSWFLWPGRYTRPQMIHSSQSLISCLTFQLCLSVLGMEALPICDGCHMDYTPEQRAPKAGQMHFCPGCRDQGIPQKYARQAHRARLREKKLSAG